MEKYILIDSDKFDTLYSEIKGIRDLIEGKSKEEYLKKWVPKREAKDELHVCQKTVDNYLKRGVIPYSRYAGKIYIKREDIEAHLNRNYIKTNNK
jgi:hypothetical protein